MEEIGIHSAANLRIYGPSRYLIGKSTPVNIDCSSGRWENNPDYLLLTISITWISSYGCPPPYLKEDSIAHPDFLLWPETVLCQSRIEFGDLLFFLQQENKSMKSLESDIVARTSSLIKTLLGNSP